MDGLTSKIATALGLSLLAAPLGCVTRSLDDPDSMGGGGGSSGEGTEGTASDGSATSGMSGTATATVGEDGTESGTVLMCVPSEDWLEWELWWPPTVAGECVCDEECQAEALAQWDEANCCGSCSYAFGLVSCAELVDGMCHYLVSLFEDVCGEGRPLFVNGQARRAPACARDDWAHPATPRLADLDAPTRQWLAERWSRSALAEHASVASFARFVLDLSAMGAPPELLADATAAMQDEIRHARVAFGLASAYRGEPVGPGPLPMHGVTAGGDAEAIVRAAVREGCVEETLAAAEAELAAHRATDPVVRAALLAIAEDESRHAVLAWRFVDWALHNDPELLAAVHDEIARAALAASRAAEDADTDAEQHAASIDPELASAHGVLPEAMRHQLRARCLSHTIRPCAAAMLDARSQAEAPRA